MRERHWEQLTADLGVSLHPDENFTFQQALDMDLPKHEEAITKVADAASKEFSIEQALDKMQGEWEEVTVGVMAYRETGTYVVKLEEATV